MITGRKIQNNLNTYLTSLWWLCYNAQLHKKLVHFNVINIVYWIEPSTLSEFLRTFTMAAGRLRSLRNLWRIRSKLWEGKMAVVRPKYEPSLEIRRRTLKWSNGNNSALLGVNWGSFHQPRFWRVAWKPKIVLLLHKIIFSCKTVYLFAKDELMNLTPVGRPHGIGAS